MLLSRTVFGAILSKLANNGGVEMRVAKVIGLSFVLLQLVACGGGGSSNTAAPATTGVCATAANCALPSSVSAVPPQN